jgi:hypothetical protein
MIVPFIPGDLFKLNSNLKPKFDGEVLIIDNIFKNYQNILDICHNMPVEQWKTNSNSRNFKDYYDCRPIFQNHSFNETNDVDRLDVLNSLLKHYFKENNSKYATNFTFNYFKHLKNNVSKNYQHYPHFDDLYNIIFYIDPFENGGTALYEQGDFYPIMKESDNLMYNISDLKIKKIIKSKPNRCVIFSGKTLHGGYIEDHSIYYYNWRINLVQFVEQK